MKNDCLSVPASWAAVTVSVMALVGAAALYVGDLKFAPRAPYATKSDIDSVMSAVRQVAAQQEGLSIRFDILMLQRIPSEIRTPHRTGRRP